MTSAAWVAALVCWIVFIWGNSLTPGPASDDRSLAVVNYLQGVFGLFGVTSVPLMNHIVRKCAHFGEYLLLGLLDARATLRLRERGRGGRIACGLVAVGVPVIDETIQLFVVNRSGQVSDVLLDTCGVCVGLLIMELVEMHKEGRRDA